MLHQAPGIGWCSLAASHVVRRCPSASRSATQVQRFVFPPFLNDEFTFFRTESQHECCCFSCSFPAPCDPTLERVPNCTKKELHLHLAADSAACTPVRRYALPSLFAQFLLRLTTASCLRAGAVDDLDSVLRAGRPGSFVSIPATFAAFLLAFVVFPLGFGTGGTMRTTSGLLGVRGVLILWLHRAVTSRIRRPVRSPEYPLVMRVSREAICVRVHGDPLKQNSFAHFEVLRNGSVFDRDACTQNFAELFHSFTMRYLDT